MEPISTMVLIAGFLLPPIPTRPQQWGVMPLQSSGFIDSALVRTNVLIAPSNDLIQSEEPISPSLMMVAGADRLEAVIVELSLYSELQDGWDGDGSSHPHQEHIDDAKTFLSALPAGFPIPKAMLSASGEVGLYWDTSEVFADIVFDGSHKFSLFIRSKTGSFGEVFSETVDVAQLPQQWFAENLQQLINA